MIRHILLACALAVAVGGAGSTAALAWGAEFAGPGPEITGNDTGGIFPYRPAPRGVYQEIADSFCARYGRLAKVTSLDRAYGDYVSFVCYDRPGHIH